MPTRRQFVARTGTLFGTASLVGGCADDSGDSTAEVADFGDDTPLPTTLDNEAFYQISSSSWVPTAEWLAGWSLKLRDGTGAERALSLTDLQNAGGSDLERTISCIGSSSGYLMGNAWWTGIRLDALLAYLGVDPVGDWILFVSGDGYSTCVPRSDVEAGLTLVWRMNGVDLPEDHGAPLRALTPGRYGQKNPKWIESIEFVPDYIEGFWESRGWSDEATYQISSWFLEPREYSEVSQQGVWLKGCAFAGEAGISRVEISDDGGTTWKDAEITYAGGPGVWTLWRFPWVAPYMDVVEVRVRATAADGRVQGDLEPSDQDLDGFEGLHRWTYVVV